jgi:hypothetical protein
MDDKMKMLFNVANHIALTNIHRENNNSNQSNEITDSKSCFVLDKLIFSPDK